MNDNPIGAIFGITLVIYMIICSLVVPTYMLSMHNQERDCARTHQVFACEGRMLWTPKEIDQ
jgi:hypothetical protein